MTTFVESPIPLLESLAVARLPEQVDDQLQRLMDRNTNGALTPEEKENLAGLAELSETMALFRAQALRILGRRPQ